MGKDLRKVEAEAVYDVRFSETDGGLEEIGSSRSFYENIVYP